MVKKIIYLVSLAMLALPFELHAATSPQFSAELSNRGRSLEISFQSPDNVQCTGTLTISSGRSNLPQKVLLAEIPTFSSLTLQSTDLKAIYKRSGNSISAGLNARFFCNNGRAYSRSDQVNLPTLRRAGNAYRSLRHWAQVVTVKLATSVVQATDAFPPTLTLVNAFPNLTFSSPVELKDPLDGSDRLFIVEQNGKIFGFSNDASVASASQFLDISSKVEFGGERGLLGLAFHPRYEENGFFFVNYTRAGDGATVVSRFKVSANPSTADPASEKRLLVIPQPFANHNGGNLQFGPDGFLYIAMGDGGSAGDPRDHAQDRRSLLGKILRINVNSNTSKGYLIPRSNPYARNRQGYKKEIFARGFRNPWKTSFDPLTKKFWVGDVGQGDREEIDLVRLGDNYGWNTMEGSLCYPPGSGCSKRGLELPLQEYDHSQGESVTGGYVYRGSEVPLLNGVYIYGDFSSGRIWGIRRTVPKENALLSDTSLSISTFGIDKDGEVFVVDYAEGKIYRFQ